MKKLFCILFCLIFTTFALVGCGDVERDEWLGQGTNEDGNVVGAILRTQNSPSAKT